MAPELTKAKISRGVNKSYLESKNRLSKRFVELEGEEKPTDISIEQIAGLENFVHKAQNALCMRNLWSDFWVLKMFWSKPK